MESFEDLRQQNEDKNRFLLRLETVLGYLSSVSFLALILVASYVEMSPQLRIILIVLGSVIFAIGIANAVKIEQIAGYYECGICGHRYIPSYNSVLFSRHIGRTRYLKCPHCEKKSWNKKVLTK